MKKGILNLPDSTLSLNWCRVGPSNGSAPHTRTYRTTPRLCSQVTVSRYIGWRIFYFIYFAHPDVNLRPDIFLPLEDLRHRVGW